MQNNDLQPRDKRYDMAYAQQMSGHVPADIYHIAAEFQARSVHPANPAHSEEKRIIDRTVEFCITRNIRNVPDIYILDSDIPNAASVSGNHMIMTTAILEGLSPEKLDAIIGHELSHHRHSKRDVIAQGAIGLVGGSMHHSYGLRKCHCNSISRIYSKKCCMKNIWPFPLISDR